MAKTKAKPESSIPAQPVLLNSEPLVKLLHQDAERCRRTDEQQLEAIVAAYFGADVSIGGAWTDHRIALLRVFSNLADAINAVSDHPDTPDNIRRVLFLAVDEIGNLYHEDVPPDYVNRVLQVAAKLVGSKGGESDDE